MVMQSITTSILSVTIVVVVLISTSLATTSEASVAADTNATAAAAAATRMVMMMRPPGTVCKRGTMPTKLALKCWIAILFEVPFCVFEIADVFDGGSIFSVGKVCCHAFIDLTEDCKIEVFQHAKFFPVIEKFCSILVTDDAVANATSVVVVGDRSALPPASA